ncbi:MAG: ABC transporter ATP-binding protein [Calditrichaeota bacterium]|nr:ABC transporter ATP-binding protein [Calditrichota bacterium]MCB9368977.1 ABC transporter ATP-binding protein [Calditrichota bacterium]
MSDIIVTENICKDYKLGTHVVHALVDVNLHVGTGEFLSIVGPSGSGKTTLLNMIGCLDVPTSGKVTMFGKFDPAALDDKETTLLRRDRIGFIFQTFNLLPVFNVTENVGLPLELQHVPKDEIEQRVSELVEEVGLTEYARHRPDELSGGQRQRVAVARALVTNPKLVLADEPTANLDHDTGMAILELMQEMNRVHGTTFIFSTHDPKVMSVAKRIVTMEDGKISEDNHVA